jgi:hypothetical protein
MKESCTLASLDPVGITVIETILHLVNQLASTVSALCNKLGTL